MHFDPSFFKGELRNDFYISPMVKRAWAVQLDVLEQIDIICKRHNIMYYAEWGTLLGAIRHQGFVPWDDDLDIGMRRKDFVRFMHYAKTELPKDYQILTVHSSLAHRQVIVRVVNTMTINTEPSFLAKNHNFPYIAGMDIFITDNVPKNPAEEAVQLELIRITDALARRWDKDDDMTEEEKIESVREIERLCNYQFNDSIPIAHQLIMLEDHLCSMYWDDEPNFVALMVKLASYTRYKLPVEYYKSTIDVPFEHTTIPVPVGYLQILESRYGDWKIEKRLDSSHDYPFFKSQQERLFNEYEKRGIKIPDIFKEE